MDSQRLLCSQKSGVKCSYSSFLVYKYIFKITKLYIIKLHIILSKSNEFIFNINKPIFKSNFSCTVKEEMPDDPAEIPPSSTKKKGVRSFCIDDILSYKTAALQQRIKQVPSPFYDHTPLKKYKIYLEFSECFLFF